MCAGARSGWCTEVPGTLFLPKKILFPSQRRQILKVLAWFVACGGDCRYKWEKKSGNFLEIEKNLRNFASSSEKTTSEWQEKKTISLTIKNSKIMVKKNEEESARTLKKEELENVNGGINKKRKYDPWSTDRYSILFQIEKRKSDRLPLLYYNLTTMCVLVLGQFLTDIFHTNIWRSR